MGLSIDEAMKRLGEDRDYPRVFVAVFACEFNAARWLHSYGH
jgi:hypothetical protein